MSAGEGGDEFFVQGIDCQLDAGFLILGAGCFDEPSCVTCRVISHSIER